MTHARANDSRLHVTVVGQLPPPIGGFSYISDCVVKELQKTHQVCVYNIAPTQGKVGFSKHLSRMSKSIAACVGLIKARRFGLKICYHPCEGGLGLVYTVAVAWVARLCGHRVILHHHSFQYVDRWKPLMRLVLWLSDDSLHVFLCSIMRDSFERQYRQITNSIVVSNAAFVPLVAGLPPRDSTKLVMGHLSNLSREKGLYRFIDLLRLASGRGLPVRAILAGPVSSQADQIAIEHAVAEFQGALEYRGAIYGAEKNAFYNEIDVFVFPTQYVNEAQPTVIFEAIASGCSIVSYDRGCIRGQVREGHGLIIDRDKPFVESALDWVAARANNLESVRGLSTIIEKDFASRRSEALAIVDEMVDYSIGRQDN
ncbi:glycosyltransferase family 4 protein (plasmid) [Rhizobium sp. WL3]|uniref:glycosyltransferase family 4 protein n=1 Tax=Rhizobium sp. WL3 TaxID=2603277 RepID=UPI0011C1F687|nr:glycosyltransferase family 4 protein [Rhizobium sp. WL3]QEE43369.1 glycosyltransferase family 4 protein [Rhizobium sp. WL3]